MDRFCFLTLVGLPDHAHRLEALEYLNLLGEIHHLFINRLHLPDNSHAVVNRYRQLSVRIDELGGSSTVVLESGLSNLHNLDVRLLHDY